MRLDFAGVLMALFCCMDCVQASNGVDCIEAHYLSASEVLAGVLSKYGVKEWSEIEASVKKDDGEYHVSLSQRPWRTGSQRYYILDLCGNIKLRVPLP